MKKTLLAAALLAGFAGAASAQSSVTLYGIVDAGLQYTNFSYSNSAASTSSLGVKSGGQSGSRFGLKGVEDLGGGNQAIFDLESGINVNNGTPGDSARLFNRLSWFGVQNAAWGNVKFGRQNSLAWDYMGVVTDPLQINNSITASTATITWDASRYDNLLSY